MILESNDKNNLCLSIQPNLCIYKIVYLKKDREGVSQNHFFHSRISTTSLKKYVGVKPLKNKFLG